jgi:hypothetical protein
MDGIFLGERAIHHNNKMLLQKKATEKWYRAVPFKNLTERSERILLATKRHPSARGTSTLPNNALLSTHYGAVRP